MYKKLFVFLSLFLSANSFGADHCTNPTEYTIDERCYVTDEQKERKPYNSVVALIDDDEFIYCTGTIVQGENGKPYVYTAKHCILDENNLVQSTLRIKLQDGTELNVTKNKVGDFDIATDGNESGDWAVYSINKTDVPMVEKIFQLRVDGLGLKLPMLSNIKLVGYGTLKIMSDKEITEFKDKYIAYLKDKEKIDIQGTEYNYGFDSGGIDTLNEYVINFIDNNDDYWETLNSDSGRLKVSACEYFFYSGKEIGCQAWGGNSGGAIFDSGNRIMGILTRGNYIIGGEYHAGREDLESAKFRNSLKFFKNVNELK